MTIERAQIGRGFWLWWVLASTVSIAAGFFVAFRVGGGVGAVALGVPVGIAQWLVLRQQVSRSGWWVLASTVGFAVSGAASVVVANAVESAVGETVSGALGGVVFATLIGVAQWLVLRREIARAGVWVLASAFGWTAGLAVGLSLGSALEGRIDEAVGFLVAAAIGGAVVGAITGGFLVWLLRQPATTDMGPTQAIA